MPTKVKKWFTVSMLHIDTLYIKISTIYSLLHTVIPKHVKLKLTLRENLALVNAYYTSMRKNLDILVGI